MGLPAFPEGLTPQQKRIAVALCDGLSEMDACRRAGYQSPGVEAYNAARLPIVAAAVQAELRRRLIVRAAPIAVKTLIAAAAAPLVKADRGAIDACKTILDRAGLVAPRTPSDGASKGIGDMSSRELHDLLRRLNGELGDRAKPAQTIDIAPESAPEAAEDADMFE